MSSSEWIKFFESAGLPNKYAGRYAMIFVDHRIQKDMLKDLSKEILHDMGIKTMGDVIAILRHAKEVDEEETRAKLFGGSNGTSRATAISASSAVAAAAIAAATSASSSSTDKLTQIKKLTNIAPPSNSQTVSSSSSGISDSLARRLGPPSGVKRTAESASNTAVIKKRISGPSEIQESTAPARVVRLPNTSQSASVFARLGNSTLDVTTGSDLRAGKVTATVKPTTVIPKGSVMDRLGYKTESNKLQTSNSNYTLKNQMKEVVTANNRVSKPSFNTNKTISLKKSVFDRLGS